MLEWFFLFGVCVMMAKIGMADGRSGLTWGILTFVLCLGPSFISHSHYCDWVSLVESDFC